MKICDFIRTARSIDSEHWSDFFFDVVENVILPHWEQKGVRWPLLANDTDTEARQVTSSEMYSWYRSAEPWLYHGDACCGSVDKCSRRKQIGKRVRQVLRTFGIRQCTQDFHLLEVSQQMKHVSSCLEYVTKLRTQTTSQIHVPIEAKLVPIVSESIDFFGSLHDLIEARYLPLTHSDVRRKTILQIASDQLFDMAVDSMERL
jgi:hypothetical protein